MSDTADRTDEVFGAAAALSAEKRPEYLDRACGADRDLRAGVEALLQAHDRQADFVSLRASANPGPTRAYAPSGRKGAVVAGRYKLLEQIGEGGMGTVWVAEQTQPVNRRVALKLIKAGMDSKSVLARFDAERQALARMDHPNIARVFDGGLTESQLPFFVMEYVKGAPITEYCDSVKMSVPDRLQLFVQVCQAVQHAHQKGIIHRDLKPSNVLVAPCDDRPVPKVIDFGLAKAIHEPLTEHTLYTAHETVVGTPLYMSPEQAQWNNLDIDTRTDVYSLGVLLYELLTGSTPLEKTRFKEAAWDEIRRIIREEEPPLPSARLSSTDTLPSLAAFRQTDPLRLAKQVKGELDWIVMKALEKDRTRRYDTANGLARDIQRYLADEVVEARPPSNSYRLRKFIRRHRGQAVAAAAFVLLLTTGVVVSTSLAVRAARAEVRERAGRDEAERQRDVAKAINDLLLNDILDQANPDARAEHDPDIKLKTVLDRAAARVDGRFPDQPLVEAAVRLTVGEAYLALDREADAERQVRRAHELRRRELGEDHADALAAMHTLGRVYEEWHDFPRCLEVFRDVYERRLKTLGADHSSTLESMNSLGAALQLSGDPAAAVPLHEQVLATRRRTLGDAHRQTVEAMQDLGSAYRMTKQFSRSIALREEALAASRASPELGTANRYTLSIMNGLAMSYIQGGPDDPAGLNRAETLLNEMRSVSEQSLGPTHSLTLLAMNNLGLLYAARKDYDRAEQQYRRTLAARSAALGAEHDSTLITKGRLATVLESKGEDAAAVRMLREVVAVRLRVSPGIDRPETQSVMARLAAASARIGEHAAAEAEYAALLPAQRRRLGDRAPEVAATLTGLGRAMLGQRKFAAAETPLREAVAALATKTDGASADADVALGESLLGQQRYVEAEPLLLRGFESMKQQAKPNRPKDAARIANVVDRLIELYSVTKRPVDTKKWQAEQKKYAATPK